VTKAAEPELADLPRFPALEPVAAKASFVLREGFQIELAASEPNIASPVAMCFDENGRLFVVEMRDYSEHRDEKLGRIRMLEDTDNDGHFDKSTVFAENLAWPTALIWANGGLFVGSTPDILFLRDKDGDGKADERTLLFTGFASSQPKLNVQQLFNSFTWGVDNRIHGSTASNGGTIQQIVNGQSVSSLPLGSRDFSFSPRTLSIRPETGGGQHGMSFDDAGRKFICSNSSHIRMAVIDDRYLQGVTGLNLPPSAIDIAKEGPAAEVFRLSPEEPWRTVRTRWRVNGDVPGLIEGGGRASGYFTGATGVTIYRGDAFPPEFSGNAFVGDAGGNLVHRKILRPNGVPFEASRPDDELNREFLASRDTWFRPVQFANGPDGCLYVIDMYREVIEHPWSLPANLKKHIDLNSGRERGRIWRIAPKDFKRPPQPKLGNASTAELVEALRSKNGWTRDTASRLLCERNDKSAANLIEQKIVLNRNSSDATLIHGLYLLSHFGALKANHLDATHPAAAADSRSSNVKEAQEVAIRLIETLSPDQQIEALKYFDSRKGLATARIENQYAWTLGKLTLPDRTERLAQLAESTRDPYIQSGILVSAQKDSAALFHRLISSPTIQCDPDLLAQLASQLPLKDITEAFARAEKLENRADAFKLAASIAESPNFKKAEPPAALNSLFAEARAALEKSPGTSESRAALNLLRQDRSPEAAAVFQKTFLRAVESSDGKNSRAGHLSDDLEPAFRGLLKNPTEAAATLWKVWPSLPLAARARALDLLLARNEGASLTLEALRAKKIARLDLTASQTQTLRQNSNPAISRPALELLGAIDADRAAVIEKFRPALTTAGDLDAGRKIFTERCATCHRLAGQGAAVGPDLESVRGNGREYLLTHLIDPNREVNARYVAYTADLRDAEPITGLLARETDAAITLRLANAEEKNIPRAQIRSLAASAQSLMPNGLEADLDPKDMASLLDFLRDAR
jgi:putative membrane-bound dehydrogenase-like protein